MQSAERAKKILEAIWALPPREVCLMEVCGTHTMAIAEAGIRTLLREAAVSVDEVETLYIAGGFGSRLNLKSAARIGLIPAELVPRAEVLGNASLDGACRLLLSEAYRKEAAETAKNARCLNAASCPGFSEDFVACMLFETE